MPDRIAVIGNCQASTIAEGLKALSPKTTVDPFTVNSFATSDAREGAIAALERYDLILSQNLTQFRLGPLTSDRLKEKFPDIVFFPQIAFTGFHPDTFYLLYKKRALDSVTGKYHSLLVAAAFFIGIPPDRTARLFNTYIFSCSGYFDEYEMAKSFLLSHAADLGYDLMEAFDEWQATGPFMHTINHPKVRVLSGIAVKIAARIGIDVTGTAENIPDRLLPSVVLPVYPALADRLGMSGDTNFKLSERSGAKTADILTLEEYIHETYRIYAGYPREAFQMPRIKRARAILRRELV
jgi:hypothetical protein